jgi:hypothetical protein
MKDNFLDPNGSRGDRNSRHHCKKCELTLTLMQQIFEKLLIAIDAQLTHRIALLLTDRFHAATCFMRDFRNGQTPRERAHNGIFACRQPRTLIVIAVAKCFGIHRIALFRRHCRDIAAFVTSRSNTARSDVLAESEKSEFQPTRLDGTSMLERVQQPANWASTTPNARSLMWATACLH